MARFTMLFSSPCPILAEKAKVEVQVGPALGKADRGGGKAPHLDLTRSAAPSSRCASALSPARMLSPAPALGEERKNVTGGSDDGQNFPPTVTPRT